MIETFDQAISRQNNDSVSSVVLYRKECRVLDLLVLEFLLNQKIVSKQQYDFLRALSLDIELRQKDHFFFKDSNCKDIFTFSTCIIFAASYVFQHKLSSAVDFLAALTVCFQCRYGWLNKSLEQFETGIRPLLLHASTSDQIAGISSASASSTFETARRKVLQSRDYSTQFIPLLRAHPPSAGRLFPDSLRSIDIPFAVRVPDNSDHCNDCVPCGVCLPSPPSPIVRASRRFVSKLKKEKVKK